MSPTMARFEIEASLKPNGRFYIKNEDMKIHYILKCIDDEDWAVRQEIDSFIRSNQPQYIKVLENPNKYRILF